jgi:hypothetical protein
VDPVPDPLLRRKSGSAGNRTGTSWKIFGPNKNEVRKIANSEHGSLEVITIGWTYSWDLRGKKSGFDE